MDSRNSKMETIIKESFKIIDSMVLDVISGILDKEIQLMKETSKMG